MTVYGTEGWFFVRDKENCLGIRNEGPENIFVAPPPPAPFEDPISMLTAIVYGKAAPNPLSSLENNLVVMEILEAARESARSGKTIILPH